MISDITHEMIRGGQFVMNARRKRRCTGREKNRSNAGLQRRNVSPLQQFISAYIRDKYDMTQESEDKASFINTIKIEGYGLKSEMLEKLTSLRYYA